MSKELLPASLRRVSVKPLSLGEGALSPGRLATLAFSISGVQPKWTGDLDPEGNWVMGRGGSWILKPPNPLYPYLPELELMGMRLLESTGVPIAESGLLRSTEGAWIFLSKRFDLGPQQQHLVMEDFCQLLGLAEEKKYEASLEQVAKALLQYSRTPDQDRIRLWKVAVVAWLIGNADLHLKNLSMLEGSLSPAYDMVPTQLILPGPEETALSLCGKRSRFRRKHWVEEFGEQILGIPRTELEQLLIEIRKAADGWPEIITGIPLPEALQKRAIDLMTPRLQELLTASQ